MMQNKRIQRTSKYSDLRSFSRLFMLPLMRGVEWLYLAVFGRWWELVLSTQSRLLKIPRYSGKHNPKADIQERP